MKKAISLGLIVMLTMSFAAPVFADAGERLQDGFKQAVLSPKQIPDIIQEEYEAAEFKPFGVMGGIIKGLMYFVKDLTFGLFKTLTFPVDWENLGQ